MTRGLCVRPLLYTGSMAALIAVLVSGCSSYEERWGRDPKEVTRAPAPKNEQSIELAKTEVMHDEQQPDNAAEDLSPVSVLFVNGDAITVEDVLKWIRPDLEKLVRSTTPDEYASQLLDTVRVAIRARVENQLLYQVASRRLKEQELDRLETFVDGRIREIVNRDHGGRQTRYEQWLAARGITPAEDRERIRRETLIGAYIQRTIGERIAEPTRRELERYYKQYRAEAAGSEGRRMLLIDVPYGETDATGRPLDEPLTLETARKEMNEALAELKAGKPFADVARAHSQGINAYAGGDWGFVTREGLRSRWQPAVKALYQLGDGETSDVIETDQALFLVKCAAVKSSDVLSFSEMQTELVDRYKRRQFDLLSAEMIAKLYQDAVIRPENAGRFLRAVIEAAPQPTQAVSQAP